MSELLSYAQKTVWVNKNEDIFNILQESFFEVSAWLVSNFKNSTFFNVENGLEKNELG